MRVGVITFHRAINYGAALQTYALQKALLCLGVDVELIDYRCEYMEKLYKPIGGFNQKMIKQNIRSIINFIPYKRKVKSFREMMSDNLNLSAKVYDSSSISSANDRYDVFITGSDQVFNYACSRFDKNYFLSFVQDERKIFSYAASFGVESIPEQYRHEYRKLLNRFNGISVREESGRSMVWDLLGRECNVHVDPVFLLDTEDWSRLAKRPKATGYILIYRLNKSNIINDFARKLAEKTGKRIINVGQDIIDRIKNPDFDGSIGTSVEEFLGLIKYADYVVTNSFHGTALSIIFKRNFYVETKQKDFKKNDRAEHLLKLTGLTGSSIESVDDCILNVPRDFYFADTVLQKEKQAAMDYLREMCSNE